MDGEEDFRENLLDYVRYARGCVDQLLATEDSWSREELAEISSAADAFADIFTIVKRRRGERLLANWLK